MSRAVASDAKFRCSRDTPLTLALERPRQLFCRLRRDSSRTLIAMCKHSRPEDGKLLGRTAMKVLRNAPCLLCLSAGRGATPWRLHHILVPHDGTPSTSAALPPAADLAERGRAELLVAHITNIGAAPPSLALSPHRFMWISHSTNGPPGPASSSNASHAFARSATCTCGCSSGTEIPQRKSTAWRKEQSTDLMVLAWRGVWEAPRAAVFKGILREAQCPTMVVRA